MKISVFLLGALLSVVNVSAAAPDVPHVVVHHEPGRFAATLAGTARVQDVGSTRQLLVDRNLLESAAGLEWRLQQPQRREIVFRRDAPWEGSGSGFERIIRVGDVFRMYYSATKLTINDGRERSTQPTYACVAESSDGIYWNRPELGLFEFEGSKRNNIVWAEPGLDNFTPFLDTNPTCPPDERFKALVGMDEPSKKGLFVLKSADGLRWSPLQEAPILTQGRFDSQNNAFWDETRQYYWCYFRGFEEGIRDVRVATSKDFRVWSEPQPLRFGDAPREQLYTNQIEPYYRAPGLFVGFPTRYIEREVSATALQALPDPVHRERRKRLKPRFGTAFTDGLFMTSRDGYEFRRWEDPFLPTGIQRDDNWVYGDGYQSLGLIETPSAERGAPPELSFYAGEGLWKDGPPLRRYTLRLDGFVSVHGGRSGGEFVTQPLIFHGRRLTLNFSTSVAGAVRVQIEGVDGTPWPGFAYADCEEIFGDAVDRTVVWRNGATFAALSGQPVRLRVALREADLYAFKFDE
jgi:hypothetical protein